MWLLYDLPLILLTEALLMSLFLSPSFPSSYPSSLCWSPFLWQSHYSFGRTFSGSLGHDQAAAGPLQLLLRLTHFDQLNSHPPSPRAIPKFRIVSKKEKRSLKTERQIRRGSRKIGSFDSSFFLDGFGRFIHRRRRIYSVLRAQTNAPSALWEYWKNTRRENV